MVLPHALHVGSVTNRGLIHAVSFARVDRFLGTPVTIPEISGQPMRRSLMRERRPCRPTAWAPVHRPELGPASG